MLAKASAAERTRIVDSGARARLASPIGCAIGLVLAAGLLARDATLHCERFIPDLDRLDVALAHTSPPLGPVRPALAHRVVLVVVDGLGDWASRDLRTLSALRRAGASAGARSELPSSSRPNYVSILTGVPPAYSGARTNHYRARVPLDSLPRRAHASGVASVYVTDSGDSVATLFPDFDEVAYAVWSGGLDRATELALARDYRLVVLLAGGVDACGHERAMTSGACTAARRAADDYLARVVAQLDFSRDTLIVTADHGHVPTGGHGGSEASVVRVPLVLAGAGVAANAHSEGARLIDIAPTVAVLLGLAAPRHALGTPLVELLRVPADDARDLLAEASRRIELNATTVAAEQRAGRAEQRARRAGDVASLAAIALGIVLATWLLVACRAMALRPCDLAAGCAVVLAGTLAMFACCDCFGSPSSFSNRAEWTARAVLAFAVALVGLFLGTVARWRRPAREQLAAGNAIAWIVVAIAAFTTAWLWLLQRDPFVVLPSDGLRFALSAVPPVIASLCLAVAIHRGLDVVLVLVRCAPLPADPPSLRRHHPLGQAASRDFGQSRSHP